MMRRWKLVAVAGMMMAAAMPLAAQNDMRPPPRPGAEERIADAAGPAPADAEQDIPADAAAAPSDLAIAALALTPNLRPDDLLDGHGLKLALEAARRDDWDTAMRLAAAQDGIATQIIAWRKLRAGVGDFDEYQAFLARNPDWPGLDLLRRRGEAEIAADADPDAVIGYFDGTPPETGHGAFRLAQALEARGQPDKARATVLLAWRELEMGATDEAEILAAYRDTVAPAHAERLDLMLWRKNRSGILRAMERAPAGHKALAEARIALQHEAAGVDTLIGRVPARLQGDGGLAFDRMIWRIEKRRRDEAADLIVEQSISAEALGRPREWAEWRRVLARQAMRDGDGQRAYDLASSHHIAATTDFYPYADLEWLAGYVALTYLDDPAAALRHFKAHTKAVFTPISLGRGHYWEGRAHEALGDDAAAQASFRKGGVHQTSFYGLLSAERAGMALDPALVGDTEAPDWTEAAFTGSTVFKAAQMLFAAGERWETIRFLSHLSETVPEGALIQLGDFAADLGDPYVAVRVAKQIVRRQVVPVRAYFPLVGLGVELPVEEALALSIARRESEFNLAAVSPVGARGLMQLMPGTAKLVSGKLGMPYVLARLTTDGPYNATLGSAYLADLIEEFGPNYALVAAGYNAGPGRPRRWVGMYGDPRYPGTDPVDWVEHIPFRETRNYVMRVTESVPIYRARLTGETGPIGLREMLTAR